MKIHGLTLWAGCDQKGRVRLWLGNDEGHNLEPLTNETWPTVTATKGHQVGMLVEVDILPCADSEPTSPAP